MPSKKREFNLAVIETLTQYPEGTPKEFRMERNNIFDGYRIFEMKTGDTIVDGNVRKNHFFFVINGHVSVEFSGEEKYHLTDGEMMMLTYDLKLRITATKPTRILLHTFTNFLPECERHINGLFRETELTKDKYNPVLPIHPLIRDIGVNILNLTKAGLMSAWLTRVKRLEVFYLICVCYKPEEVVSFFRPLVNKQLSFRTRVLNNYEAVGTVDGLAEALGMCRTNFYKRFKDEFGMPAHKWIQIRKAWQVREYAAMPDMDVKKLMVKTGFPSPSNFIRFCQTHFGRKPSELIECMQKGGMPELQLPFSQLED